MSTHVTLQVTTPELLAVSTIEADVPGQAILVLKADDGRTHLVVSGDRDELAHLSTRIRAALGEQPSGGLREGYTHGPYWLEQQEGGALWIMGWDPDAENWPALVAVVETEEDAAMILDRLGYRRTKVPSAAGHALETPCPICKYPVRVQPNSEEIDIEPTCECLDHPLVDAIGYVSAVEEQVRCDGRLAA